MSDNIMPFSWEPTAQNEDVSKVLEAATSALEDFNNAVAPIEYEVRPVCIPGIGDIFLRRVARLGYKGDFPRPYDWENLLPQLMADEELLWIIQKKGCAFNVYLGLKYTGDNPPTKEEWEHRGKRFAIFTRHFARAAFPESLLEKDRDDPFKNEKVPRDRKSDEMVAAEFLSDIVAMETARIVVGMPSIKDAELKTVAAKRDERVRPYAGLNDIVEMFGQTEDDFALVFTVSKAQAEDIYNDFRAWFTLQDKVKPAIEIAGQISKTSTDSTPGGKRTELTQDNLLNRFKNGCGDIKRYFRKMDGYQKPNLRTRTQYGTQETIGATVNLKVFSSEMAFRSEQINDMLAQLRQVLGTGGYYCAAVAYSNDFFVSESLATSVCATLSGGQSSLFPMRVHRLDSSRNKDWLVRKKSFARVLAEEGVPRGIMNCEKACLYLPVPTTHLVGLPIKKNVFYGKDSPTDGGVKFGVMSFAEKCIANETVIMEEDHLELSIRHDDFYSHFFVVGTTGSGKTKRSAHILHCAQGFRRIILETAKKTYWNELGLAPDELIVYTLGDSTHNPLRFNPFYFEPGTNLKQHIAVLADAMTDLLPTSALIGPKLREAAERCYVACGWNIETSKRDDSECELEYPNVAMFKLMVKEVVNEMKDYGNETRGDYTGALLHRASIFMDAVYQDIFAFDGNKTIDELFPPDKAVIIEMEEMPPSEINMPAFIISLLLHRIRAYQSREIKRFTEKEWEKVPGFLIAIEEAHNVLSKSIQQKGDETQSGKGGHLVKQVTRLLAEGRGMHIGMMIIDQSAANVAPSVITNTNTKLVFRQEDGTEIETIGKAIGLKKEEWNDLQLLGQGEFLIRNSRYPHPIKMAPLTKNELDMYKTWKAREEFVEEAKWVPNYQAIEKLLIPYFDVQRIACLNDGSEVSIAAYDDEADSLFKRLCSFGGNVKKDLYKYCIAKALMSLELYGWAAAVLGVNYKEPSTGGECLQ